MRRAGPHDRGDLRLRQGHCAETGFPRLLQRPRPRVRADGALTEAIRDYDKAIELKPDLVVAYNDRGAAYARAGRLTEALRDYDEALELNPDYATAYNNRGNTLADAQRDSEAIRDYDRAIALQPDFAEAYNNRGGAYARSGRLAEALRDFDEAIALSPDYAGAFCNRAMLHFQTKEYDRGAGGPEEVRKARRPAEPRIRQGPDAGRRAKELSRAMTRRTTTLLAVAALVLLGAAAYLNSLRGAFVFDDKPAIAENAAIRRLWPLGPIFQGPGRWWI